MDHIGPIRVDTSESCIDPVEYGKTPQVRKIVDALFYTDTSIRSIYRSGLQQFQGALTLVAVRWWRGEVVKQQ